MTTAKSNQSSIQYAAVTHVGRVRKRNEDACGLISLSDGQDCLQGLDRRSGSCGRDNLLALVCDGMGGGNAGDYASRFVVNQLPCEMRKRLQIDPAPSLQDGGDLLRESAEETHFKLIEEGRKDADREGMGTTLSALWLRGSRICIAQVGDSRIYRLREGQFEQLSVDQSRVGRMRASGRITEEESLEWAGKNEIEQAMGMEDRKLDVAIDFFEYRSGDLYLLCSDGLTDRLLASDLQEILAEILDKGGSLANAAEKLIAEGNRCSGRDNLTVVLLSEGSKPDDSSKTQPNHSLKTTLPSQERPPMYRILSNLIEKPVSRLFFGLACVLVFLLTFVITLIFANLNSGRIAVLQSDLETLTTDFDRVVSGLEAMHDSRGDLEAEIQTRFNTIDQRNAGLVSDVSELRSSFEIQRVEIATLRGVAARQEELEGQVSEIEGLINELEFSLNETEESLQRQLTGRLMQLVERVNALAGLVEQLETEAAQTDEGVPADE
ncbi:MAG: protein phosphatase 2C domain-containing protein [Opitutales bacterium]|nr:protein phosphatase 2C domain-containing protein [Opitutales bacterium]